MSRHRRARPPTSACSRSSDGSTPRSTRSGNPVRPNPSTTTGHSGNCVTRSVSPVVDTTDDSNGSSASTSWATTPPAGSCRSWRCSWTERSPTAAVDGCASTPSTEPTTAPPVPTTNRAERVTNASLLTRSPHPPHRRQQRRPPRSADSPERAAWPRCRTITARPAAADRAPASRTPSATSTTAPSAQAAYSRDADTSPWPRQTRAARQRRASGDQDGPMNCRSGRLEVTLSGGADVAG
jgi:hypothetical protein